MLLNISTWDTITTVENKQTQQEKMHVSIERMVGQNFQVEVEQDDSVESLKMKIYRITWIDPEQQRLIFQGQLVDFEDNKTLSDYNIQDGCVIHLSIWSTGSGAWREI